MVIGNGELMHEYFPKHSHMGTARMKIRERYRRRRPQDILSMEKGKAGTKKRSLDSLSPPNQNTIIITMYYFIRYGKVQ